MSLLLPNKHLRILGASFFLKMDKGFFSLWFPKIQYTCYLNVKCRCLNGLSALSIGGRKQTPWALLRALRSYFFPLVNSEDIILTSFEALFTSFLISLIKNPSTPSSSSPLCQMPLDINYENKLSILKHSPSKRLKITYTVLVK